MSSVRPGSPGKTRSCPHCKATILESASVCPGCQHHLRFGSDAGQNVAARSALQIEGRIKHPSEESPWEYSILVLIRNERDEEVARHVVNVGALSSGEERVVSLSVDVMPPRVAEAVVPKVPVNPAQSPLAGARPPLVPPAPTAADPSKPLPPAKSSLSPPKPGDPYRAPFGRRFKRW